MFNKKDHEDRFSRMEVSIVPLILPLTAHTLFRKEALLLIDFHFDMLIILILLFFDARIMLTYFIRRTWWLLRISNHNTLIEIS